jgi:hypothetical protein
MPQPHRREDAERVRKQITELDQDMSPRDMADVLERMKFDDDFQTIQLDAAVRNFLVATLRARKV